MDVVLCATAALAAVPLLIDWWLGGREIEERVRQLARPRPRAAGNDEGTRVVAAPRRRDAVHVAVGRPDDAGRRPYG